MCSHPHSQFIINITTTGRQQRRREKDWKRADSPNTHFLYINKVQYKCSALNPIVISKLSHFHLIGCQRGLQSNWLHFIGQADGQHPWEESIRQYLLTTRTDAQSFTHTHTHTHTGLEGNSLMPNVPFAITDGSLTFLGTGAMTREGGEKEKKKKRKRLEERGQWERREQTRGAGGRKGRRQGSGGVEDGKQCNYYSCTWKCRGRQCSMISNERPRRHGHHRAPTACPITPSSLRLQSALIGASFWLTQHVESA